MNTTKREITAKYDSRCPKCIQFINEGERVLWEPGFKAEHVNCSPAVVVPTVNVKANCEHPQFHRSDCVCAKQFPMGMGDDDRSYEAWLEFQAQQPQYISVDEIGVYVLPDGTVVKVQPNKEKTRTYAKRFVERSTIDRLTDGHEIVHGEYEFSPGLVSEVARVGRKMSADEARAFVLRYGQCVRCSRKLKDAKSVDAAMGPVCRKWFNISE